ncbi:MAG TPA: MarR family transcriptional regulator [Longimicrobiales bacterium]|nr:MarR family transcriptional regulator [Longimicrobiales bacterium]
MPSDEQFVERMGQMMERDGLPRIAGRIFGQLMLSEAPMNLDELAGALQVSKGSISTNTRLLESFGMLERLTYPGDRRDYYEVSESVHQRMLELRVERLQTTRELLEEGLETESARSERIRSRLEYFGEFFDQMIDAIAKARAALAAKRSDS